MADGALERVTLTINNVDIQAEPGTLLIKACEDTGIYVPRFCHHERMNPVGMCRMCIVEVDTGRGPTLQPSCMLTVTDGMVVDTESEATTKAQDGVLEFLLINHPLDCPVCDKGGECPLQDQTIAYGPGESRFVEEKRHFEKPIPVNDNVLLDRERCILCDRCTRFADEVAGDPLIHFMDRGNETQVNTFPDEPFSSYFSGNVVQICPVGALTAKPYRFKARPWDLDEVESTYPNAMGDRISVQSSRDQVLRFQGSDSEAVNWGWLTDKERFAFEALQSDERLTVPLLKGGGLNNIFPEGDELVAASWPQALKTAASALTDVDPRRIGLIGGARLTNEAQYAWAKLTKGILGTDNVDAQFGDELPTHALLGLPNATIADVCQPGGTIVLLGPDPKEEHGTLYIRLRHAITQSGAKLIEFTPAATGLSSLAAAKLHARPGESGLVARELLAGRINNEVGGVEPAELSVASDLLKQRKVTVVIGRPSLAETAQPTLEAIDALRSIDGVRFLSTVRRGNLLGALDMGLGPGLLPGRMTLAAGCTVFKDVWPNIPETVGRSGREILSAGADGGLDVLILLGADPLNDAPDLIAAEAALDRTERVIAVDLFLTDSVAKADVVFPAAAFTESRGSHTNFEGRVSPIRQKVTPPGTARPDWVIAAQLAAELDQNLGIDEPEDVWRELAPRSLVHSSLSTEVIDGATDGVMVNAAAGMISFEAPAEYGAIKPIDAYALRLVASRRMYDRGTLVQQSPHLVGFASDTQLRVNPYEFNRVGVDTGHLVRVISPTGELVVPVYPDHGVPRGMAVIDYNRSGADARMIFDGTELGIDVRIESSASKR